MTLMIVDDQRLFRSALCVLLQRELKGTSILEASNGSQALAMLQNTNIDLILLDINMPEMDGVSFLNYLKKTRLLDKTKVIVLTVYKEPLLIIQLIKLGIKGFLPKNCDVEILIEAIQKVSNGGSYYYNDENFKEFLYNQTPVIRLSNDEIKIVKLLAKGLSVKEIAPLTSYTENTVATKKIRIQNKLNAKNATDIVSICYRLGILDL